MSEEGEPLTSLDLNDQKCRFVEKTKIIISPDGKNWTSCFDVPTLNGVYCTVPPDVQPATRTNNLRKVGLQDGSRLLSTTYDTRDFTMSMMYLVCISPR